VHLLRQILTFERNVPQQACAHVVFDGVPNTQNGTHFSVDLRSAFVDLSPAAIQRIALALQPISDSDIVSKAPSPRAASYVAGLSQNRLIVLEHRLMFYRI